MRDGASPRELHDSVGQMLAALGMNLAGGWEPTNRTPHERPPIAVNDSAASGTRNSVEKGPHDFPTCSILPLLDEAGTRFRPLHLVTSRGIRRTEAKIKSGFGDPRGFWSASGGESRKTAIFPDRPGVSSPTFIAIQKARTSQDSHCHRACRRVTFAWEVEDRGKGHTGGKKTI